MEGPKCQHQGEKRGKSTFLHDFKDSLEENCHLLRKGRQFFTLFKAHSSMSILFMCDILSIAVSKAWTRAGL